MEDLQLVIFVFGAIAICAVLVHGFWSIRRQQPRPIKDQHFSSYQTQPGRRDADGFDADGIGEVRVRRSSTQPEPLQPVATNQEPEFSLTDAAQQAAESKTRRVKERQEPVMARTGVGRHASQVQLGLLDELDTDAEVYESQVPEADDDIEIASQAPLTMDKACKEAPLAEPRDVLVLHVVARDDELFSGAELLPCLLQLNFKFGDMEIFHRHEDNAGTGKVLFSLANMVKPGVFDPDAMEQFNTQGVVLFMTLPCHGDAVMNFSLMLNSACQLADDLDGSVLDGQRRPWSNDIRTEYLARIRSNC